MKGKNIEISKNKRRTEAKKMKSRINEKYIV